jgi:hypothetical protein
MARRCRYRAGSTLRGQCPGRAALLDRVEAFSRQRRRPRPVVDSHRLPGRVSLLPVSNPAVAPLSGGRSHAGMAQVSPREMTAQGRESPLPYTQAPIPPPRLPAAVPPAPSTGGPAW